jgi:multiple sugar transport system permease protein/raffinose/stachyose/melibiose transport system permease protein
MRNNRFVAIVLAPVFLFLFVFSVLPVFLGLGSSMVDYNPLNKTQTFLGLGNITRLFSDSVFHIALRNTLVFVFVTVLLNIMITLVIAQWISSMRNGRLRGFMRVIFFMPCVAPLVASSVIWKAMYDINYGLINTILKQLFNIAPRNWTGTPSTLMPAIILFTLWADIGYNIIILSAGIDGIPTDMYESAAIDGAGPVQRFFSITLPMLGRTLSFVFAMTLISHFLMFAQFIVFNRSSGPMSGGPNNAGMVLTLHSFLTAFSGTKEMGYGAAISLVLFCIIMVCTVVQQRLSRVDWGY